MLEQFLSSPRETIIFRFGIGIQYLVVSIGLWSFLLGGLAFFFQQNALPFLQRLSLILLALTSLFYLLKFLTTVYFISDTKIYKKVGLGWTKVTSAKHTEIDDMKVQQGFLERVLFATGTLKFNTPGSSGFEIILPLVQDPYGIKKKLYDAWQK